MGLFDWFRRKRKRPIVADKEGRSPYDQAKEIIQKQKVVEEMTKKAEEESEVTLEKFDVETATPKPQAKPKRARTVKGRYKGDDKSTTDVNEAWVGGKAPKKPRAKKTQVKKKK
tara:strand:+ start:541 stop:882 length:342 start_codon:yes stop_codon:yes gene_type:complete